MRDAILIGLLLAAIILVLFLRDWGSSIVAGLVIPATIAITLIVLRALGESFDLMTLGGLAAAVGLVIDDAIVVVENIVMHRDSGQVARRSDPQRAEGNSRAAGGLDDHADRGFSAADLDNRCDRNVFSRAGDHGGHGAADFAGAGADMDADAQPLSAAARSAPANMPAASADATGTSDHGFMGRVTRFYAAALSFAWPALLLALGCVALVVVSYFCYRALGSDLLPEMDEGGFVLDYLMPAGSSLEDTNQVLLGVEKILEDDAGGGEHVAAHGPAAGPRGGDRSQHRRLSRAAEAAIASAASTK